MNERQNPQMFGTLEEAQEQLNQALYELTELYNFSLEQLKTTPRSKVGKHIKELVENAGSRMLFARNSIAEASQPKAGQ